MRRPLAALLVLAVAPVIAGCGGDDDDQRADPFCDAASELDDRIAELDEALREGDRNPARVLRDMETELAELAEEAPAAEAEDVRAMAESVRRLARAVADVDLDQPGALDAVADDLAEIDADLDASSQRVGEVLERRCGIDIDREE